MDLISFGLLYDSVMRNEARRLEDMAWATLYASQADMKDFKKYLKSRVDPILRHDAENDVQRAIQELGGV